ncbi:hypothetical protein QAD02_001263 [Eretmocerus hayati]|uniref:Uncharacterized protein n=1 Tax=Eretmocerus hayati TaxID=131215 RepID=A0ACC2NFZ4_9HYME|nr:hypothetical protein QAD02_001263 [Eretmocerus hayati]
MAKNEKSHGSVDSMRPCIDDANRPIDTKPSSVIKEEDRASVSTSGWTRRRPIDPYISFGKDIYFDQSENGSSDESSEDTDDSEAFERETAIYVQANMDEYYLTKETDSITEDETSDDDDSLRKTEKDKESGLPAKYLKMSAQELRREIAKCHEELKKADEKFQKKSEEAENWKLQCIQIKNNFKQLKREMLGGIRKAFASFREFLDTQNISPPDREISSTNAMKEGGSKKRKREEMYPPRYIKPRKQFPLPTKFVLSEEVLAICDDPSRDVRQVVSDALPILFTDKELRKSCIVGPRARNPDALPAKQKPRGPPLEPEILNALLNRCHKNFTEKSRKDPDWYNRFMSAAKYTMRCYRKKQQNAA